MFLNKDDMVGVQYQLKEQSVRLKCAKLSFELPYIVEVTLIELYPGARSASRK